MATKSSSSDDEPVLQHRRSDLAAAAAAATAEHPPEAPPEQEQPGVRLSRHGSGRGLTQASRENTADPEAEGGSGGSRPLQRRASGRQSKTQAPKRGGRRRLQEEEEEEEEEADMHPEPPQPTTTDIPFTREELVGWVALSRFPSTPSRPCLLPAWHVPLPAGPPSCAAAAIPVPLAQKGSRHFVPSCVQTCRRRGLQV